MGKSAKLKQRQAEAAEAAFLKQFAEDSRRAATKPAAKPLEREFQPYAASFIRDPDTFVLRTRSDRRAKQVLEMARHLFGRFRVPRILDQAWETYLPDPAAGAHMHMARHNHWRGPNRNQDHGGRGAGRPGLNPNLDRIDFRAWFVCVATGGSLYKTHTKGFLSKRETHEFLACDPALDLCQAIVRAVAVAAGAAPGDAARLARSKLATKPFDPFWLDAGRFFCLPGNMPTKRAQVDDLADYIEYRHNEDRDWRLLGSSQTLPAIERRMEQWHRALARAKDLSGVQWEGVDLPDHTIEQKDPQNRDQMVTWTFHQITTGKELAAEGSAMRHCVFGYKRRCVDGLCSIWSLTRTEPYKTPVRRLTIEVNNNGFIVQKRGLANRLPRAEEDHIVKQWARAAGLGIQSGW